MEGTYAIVSTKSIPLVGSLVWLQNKTIVKTWINRSFKTTKIKLNYLINHISILVIDDMITLDEYIFTIVVRS